MPFCANCGSVVSDGDSFCGKCGRPIHKVLGNNSGASSYNLVISREKQFICAMNVYEVYINGESIGRIPVGKSIEVRLFSDEVRVEIKCITFLLTRFKLYMRLKLKENARIDFHLRYPGSIDAAVTGAEVLEEGA